MVLSSSQDGVRPPDSHLGQWSTPGFLQRSFRKPVHEFKKFDVTFSTSDDLPGNNLHEKRNAVYNFLRSINAIHKDEEVKDVIKRMKLGFNKFKEQVVIECVSEEKADQVYRPLCNVPATPRNGALRVTHVDANYFKDDNSYLYFLGACLS